MSCTVLDVQNGILSCPVTTVPFMPRWGTSCPHRNAEQRKPWVQQLQQPVERHGAPRRSDFEGVRRVGVRKSSGAGLQGEVPKLCPIMPYSCFPRDLALPYQKTPVAQVRFLCNALFFAGHWHWEFYCQRSRGPKRGPTSPPSKLHNVCRIIF